MPNSSTTSVRQNLTITLSLELSRQVCIKYMKTWMAIAFSVALLALYI